MVIAVEILVTLADFNTKQGNVSTEQDVENYAIVSSNLLEPANRITWQELDQVSISVNKISLMSFDFWAPKSGRGMFPYMGYVGTWAPKGKWFTVCLNSVCFHFRLTSSILFSRNLFIFRINVGKFVGFA